MSVATSGQDEVAPNAYSAIPEMYAVLLLSLAAATGAAWVEDTFFTGQQPTWKRLVGKIVSSMCVEGCPTCYADTFDVDVVAGMYM